MTTTAPAPIANTAAEPPGGWATPVPAEPIVTILLLDPPAEADRLADRLCGPPGPDRRVGFGACAAVVVVVAAVPRTCPAAVVVVSPGRPTVVRVPGCEVGVVSAEVEEVDVEEPRVVEGTELVVVEGVGDVLVALTALGGNDG